MPNSDFPDSYLRSQNPGQNGPLFTMTLGQILGTEPHRSSDFPGSSRNGTPTQTHNGNGINVDAISKNQNEPGKLLRNLPGVTIYESVSIGTHAPTESHSREQLLGAMVAGAEAGAQHVADTAPEPVLGPLGQAGASIIAGAAHGAAHSKEPVLIAGQPPLTKELEGTPPRDESTASRNAEDLRRLIEELDASPLMHIPEDVAQGSDRHPLAPHVYVSGITLGQVPQAFMRQEGMPTGVFGLYNPEGEYVGSFHPAPLKAGPITGFGDFFRAYSVGGVFTVPAYGSDGNVEVGPGGVAKFVLPGGIEGLFFVNARVNPSIITGEDVTLSLQGGVVINASSLASDVLEIGGRLVQLAPVPHAVTAGRAIEGTGRAIGFIDDYLMSYYVGGGYRMEARFKKDEEGVYEFEGLYIGGQQVDLEDLVEQLLTHSEHFNTPPLIPDGGNPVIQEHNINMHLAYGRNPFDIAREMDTPPQASTSVDIARRFMDYVDNTMRPHAHLLSPELQQQINQPLNSIDDFGRLYDAFVMEVEPLGMGHLRDDSGLANPYAIDGGSHYLYHANLAWYARLQSLGGIGELPVQQAIEMGILPEDFERVRRELLGQPAFDENDPSHSPDGWIELFLQ
jgi:hypothetical protein